MGTPTSGAISAGDVQTEFNCEPDFLSMRVAVYGDENTPISMSMFYNKTAQVPEIELRSTGFGFTGWNSDLEGASPYRRPSDNELAILYDPSGSSPGLWAERTIGAATGLSGDYTGDINWTWSYWRNECSSTIYLTLYTNGQQVASTTLGSSERVWHTRAVNFNNVLINETTKIRIAAINGTAWGEIGVKSSIFRFNNLEAVNWLTASATMKGTGNVEVGTAIGGTITIDRNQNTITGRRVRINGVIQSLGATNSFTFGTLTTNNLTTDSINWNFTPNAVGTYTIDFEITDNEGRTVWTNSVSRTFVESYQQATLIVVEGVYQENAVERYIGHRLQNVDGTNFAQGGVTPGALGGSTIGACYLIRRTTNDHTFVLALAGNHAWDKVKTIAYYGSTYTMSSGNRSYANGYTRWTIYPAAVGAWDGGSQEVVIVEYK